MLIETIPQQMFTIIKAKGTSTKFYSFFWTDSVFTIKISNEKVNFGHFFLKYLNYFLT